MESAQAQVRYILAAIVADIRWEDGSFFVKQGYFVRFSGSWESLHFGIEKPDFAIGDTVKITFEKQDPPCPPSPTTNQQN